MDELFADELPGAPISHEPQESAGEEQSVEDPGLKQSFGNFFINLSPKNQWMLGTTITSVLMGLLALFFLLCTTVAKGASDDMTMKITWLALLILFSVGEAVTVGLTCVWFAVGALGGLLVAQFGGSMITQIIVFLVLSGLSLALVRPMAKKFLVPGYSATNADRVIGKTAVVTLEIDNLKGQGQVSIAGQSWTARSEDGSILREGEMVKVLRIEGVKVFVAQQEE